MMLNPFSVRYSIGGCASAELFGLALLSIIAIVSSTLSTGGESLLTSKLDFGVGKEVRWYLYLRGPIIESTWIMARIVVSKSHNPNLLRVRLRASAKDETAQYEKQADDGRANRKNQ
jgi:hypothetical protein